MLPFFDSEFTQTDMGFGFICGAIACSTLHILLTALCSRFHDSELSESSSGSSSEYESNSEKSASASCSMSRSMSHSNLNEQDEFNGDLVPPPPMPVYRSEPLSPGMMSASGSASRSRSDSFSQRVQQQDELNGGMGWSAPETFEGPVY